MKWKRNSHDKDFLCHQRVDLGKNLYEETRQHDMREFSLMGKTLRTCNSISEYSIKTQILGTHFLDDLQELRFC